MEHGNKSGQKTVVYSARDILALETCLNSTSVERMAHRWYLEPADGETPELLLAPRFGSVPPLRIPSPDPARAYEVRVTGWSPLGWFSHIRVSYPGAPFPVTVTDPRFCGRPGYEDKMRKSGLKRLWKAYALTIPAGVDAIEISKTDEVESCLVSVEFLECKEAPQKLARPRPHSSPIVAGVIDNGILIAETLQAYQPAPVLDYYRQMQSMGFTHMLQQIYAGSAGWSETARPHKNVAYGHRSYANWNEPASLLYGSVKRIQEDIGRCRETGLKMVASFRINNEWLADWARQFCNTPDGIPEIASEFSVGHPEFWMTYKSGGRSGGGLDFAFPEVRRYRQDIIREWCDKFTSFDGICIDLHRHPPMVSYPEHLVREFEARTGIDVRTVEPVDLDTMIPEWLAFRARPFTEFMRGVRAMLNERYSGSMELSARVGNSFGRAMFEGADLKAWLDERLVDVLILQHRGPNPLDMDSRPIIEAAHDAGVKVVHLLGGNHGVDFAGDDLDGITPLIERWRGWGSDGFGFYEAERVGRDGRWIRDMPALVNAWARGAAGSA